jgi:hypothetical protein
VGLLEDVSGCLLQVVLHDVEATVCIVRVIIHILFNIPVLLTVELPDASASPVIHFLTVVTHLESWVQLISNWVLFRMLLISKLEVIIQELLNLLRSGLPRE